MNVQACILTLQDNNIALSMRQPLVVGVFGSLWGQDKRIAKGFVSIKQTGLKSKAARLPHYKLIFG